jgi:CheY-like chemotaxis protein
MKKKILLIDDDEGFCNSLKPIIKAEGFQLLVANDGSEGINIATETQPDLILLDIQLPDIKGNDVFLKIKENQIPTRIIFITGVRTAISDSVEFMKLGGVSDYWVKGDENLEQLVNRIKRALAIDPLLTPIEEKNNAKSKELLKDEAKRNTRIYLFILFVFLLICSLSFFHFFGIKWGSIFNLGLLTIGYFISAITLKEWTPAKLHERILELEEERIYKRFDI